MVVDIDVIKSATLFGQSRVGWRGSVIFLFTSIFFISQIHQTSEDDAPPAEPNISCIYVPVQTLYISVFFGLATIDR